MSPATIDPSRDKAIHTSATALRRMAAYVLPPELDRRILELGERKEELTEEERSRIRRLGEFHTATVDRKARSTTRPSRTFYGVPDLAGKASALRRHGVPRSRLVQAIAVSTATCRPVCRWRHFQLTTSSRAARSRQRPEQPGSHLPALQRQQMDGHRVFGYGHGQDRSAV